MENSIESNRPEKPHAALSWTAVARSWPVILVSVLLGLAVAAVAVAVQSDSYTSSTTVLLNPLDGNPYSPGTRGENLANLVTEGQLVASDPVRALVRSELGNEVDLNRNVTVDVPQNSQTVAISFSAASPSLAQRGAETFAASFLAYRQKNAQDSVQKRITTLAEAVRQREDSLAAAVKALSSTKARTADRTLREGDVEFATTDLAKLQGQLSDLRLLDTDPGHVLTPATLPSRRSGQLHDLGYLGAGALAGLLLGLLAAALRALTDDRLHTAADVERHGVAVLGELDVPQTATASTWLARDPRVPLPDDIRLIRTVLSARAPGKVLVVSALPSATSSVETWLHLATAMARVDLTVTLADCTVTAQLSEAVAAASAPGLSDLLLETCTLADSVLPLQPRLRVLPAGTRPEQTQDRLVSSRMADVLAALQRVDDWTLLVAPEPGSSETLGLATYARAIVLTLGAGGTHGSDLQRLVHELRSCDVDVVGAILEHRHPHRRLARYSQMLHRAPHAAPGSSEPVVSGSAEPVPLEADALSGGARSTASRL